MEPQLQSFILERLGCPLHYWLGGVDGAPLVVFSHGACVDHRSFDSAVAAAAQTYRVLTWDARGHGLSRPAGQPFSIPLAVDDLLAVLDQVGADRVVLVGHSNGTYISQELAFRHPQRVQALVIASGTCITCPRSALDRWLLRASGPLMALLPEKWLKQVGMPYFSNHPAVRAYVAECFAKLSKPEFIEIWNGVTTCLHEEPGYQIRQPMLLVHGDGDQTGDIRKIAPAWAAASPNCQYHVIADALHMAPMDQPGVFNDLLLNFLVQYAAGGDDAERGGR